jgi:hypothetical protein
MQEGGGAALLNLYALLLLPLPLDASDRPLRKRGRLPP